MPRFKRQPIPPTEGWHQLALLVGGADQCVYELIRPIVLFGRAPAAMLAVLGVLGGR